MSKTPPADIAAQVVELSETQVLVLRLSEGLATTDQPFQNFAAELRAILGEDLAGRIRVVVLAHDMQIESLRAEDLERVGLRRTARLPGSTPEQLFTSGPLRRAAHAGWESAHGREDSAQVFADTARTELEAEIAQCVKLDLRTS